MSSPPLTSPNRDSALWVGGIVLCGGQSTRMGRPKLSLPFDGELMLPRIVRLLSEVVQPIVVVAAPDQELPVLPKDVLITRDDVPHEGPLRGLACGLEFIAPHADAAYVCSCDVPLLKPAFVRAIVDRLADHEIAVVEHENYLHPLAGVYQIGLVARAREILRAGGRRLLDLIELSRSVRVDANDMRTVDPQLDSLRNLNTFQEYQSALKSDD